MDFLTRHPVRITITVSHALYDYLGQRSQEEGRSMSNLAAFLLEITAHERRLGDPIASSPPRGGGGVYVAA